MTKRAQRLGVGVALTTLLVAVVGCGGSDTATPDTTVAKTTLPAKDRDPTTLTLWSSFGDPDTIEKFQPIIERCQTDNPWLTIDYVGKDDINTALSAAAEAGTVPDLVQTDFSGGLAKLAATEIVAPLDQYAERDGFDWGQFVPGGERLVTFKSKHWGIPFSLDTTALFYNQDVLDEVGVDVPTTFDELQVASEKLLVRNADGRIERIGWVPDVGDGSFVVPSGLLFGGTLFNEDGTKVTLTKTDAWAASIRMQKKFFDALGPSEDVARFAGSFGSYDSSENFFITGQVPLYLEASYFATWPARFGKGKPAKWGVAPMPRPKGAPDDLAVIASGNSIFVPAKAKDLEASWVAASCMATAAKEIAAFQEFNGNIPANLEALDAFEAEQVAKLPQFQTFIDLARSPDPVAPSNSVIIETMGDEITQLALKFRRGEIPDDQLESELADLEARMQDELDLELGG